MKNCARNPLKPLKQSRKFEDNAVNIIRLVCLLSFAVLWNSVVNASADEVSDEGFRLIKSAVCAINLLN